MGFTLFVCTLVFIFIKRLRFPSNKSIDDVISSRYSIDTLKKIRKFEKLDFKYRKSLLDLNFLQKCKDIIIIPKFLQFKVTSRYLKTSTAYKESQIRLLNEEIKIKDSQSRKLLKEIDQLKLIIVKTLTYIDFIHVSSLFALSNNSKLLIAEERQHRKFINLENDINTSTHDPEKIIFNYSSYEL